MCEFVVFGPPVGSSLAACIGVVVGGVTEVYRLAEVLVMQSGDGESGVDVEQSDVVTF